MESPTKNSRWSQEEDCLLVQKYVEYNGKYSKMEIFFPNRNEKALIKRYERLNRKAKEEKMDIAEYVKQYHTLSTDEKIKSIFIHEEQNIRIYKKLTDFTTDDITDSMLQLAQSNELLVTKLVLSYKYLKEHWFDDSLTNSFFNSIIRLRVDLFLQQCIMFSVYSFTEILQKVEYAKEIHFLNQCPILTNFNTQSTNIEKARNTLSFLKEKEKTTFKEKDLLNEIEKLKKEINNKNCQINYLTSEPSKVKKECVKLINETKTTIENDYTNQIKKLIEENFLIPKIYLEKYPMLPLLIQYLTGNKKNETYLKFCSLIKLLNSNTYNYLHQLLPFPSISKCYHFTGQLQNSLIYMIQSIQCIPLILELFYQKAIQFSEHKPIKPFLICLSGDAASLKPIYKTDKNAVYAYEVLPLCKLIPQCVIHMIPTRNGSSPPEIIKRFNEIIKLLNQSGYCVKYMATDGDISFDKTHRDFFSEKIKPHINESFDDIVSSLLNETLIPLSDILHLIKSARARIVNHPLMIDIEKIICVNIELLNEYAKLGQVLEDKSQAAAMKDNYPLILYSWNTLICCLEKGRFEAAYYLLPFVLLIEAIRSPALNKEKRLQFLKYSFYIFKDHLKNIKNVPQTSLFKERYHSSCLGVLFADQIFLYRIINTIIGLSVAIMLNQENLALQRLGSHDLELFFGHMRLMCFNDHTFENALRVAARAIIVRKYCEDVEFPMKINKRVNTAGIVLTSDINNQNDFDFDCAKIVSIIWDLMRGNTIDNRNLEDMTKMINSYTKTILKLNIKQVKMPHVMSGWNPSCRLNALNYTISTLPLPHSKSSLGFYITRGKKNKIARNEESLLNWCLQILAILSGFNYEEKGFDGFNIPFSYNICKEKDRKKVTNYFIKLQKKEDLESQPENNEESAEKELFDVTKEEYENIKKEKRKRVREETTELTDPYQITDSSLVDDEYLVDNTINEIIAKNPDAKSSSQNIQFEHQIKTLIDDEKLLMHIKSAKKKESLNCDIKNDLFSAIDLIISSMNQKGVPNYQQYLDSNLIPLLSNNDPSNSFEIGSEINEDNENESAINEYSFLNEDPNLDDE